MKLWTGRCRSSPPSKRAFTRRHLLNQPFVAQAPRPRRRIYDEAVHQALMMLYEAEAPDRICGKRLTALLPLPIESMERHGYLQRDPLV